MNAGPSSYEIERLPGCSRLSLSSNLNAFHWDDVDRSAKEILEGLSASRPPGVLVDLSGLDYLGSAQLTLLVRVWKTIKERNGRMVVHVTAPVVREVLSTAGLHTLWNLADSRSAAFRALGLQEDGRPRMSPVWPVVGLVALAAALAGLVAAIVKVPQVDPRALLAGQLAFSAAALGCGLWTAIQGAGMRRGLGVGMVVAGALLAVVQVFNYPK